MRGDLNNTVNRPGLVISAPGDGPSGQGRVYGIFMGPSFSGKISLTSTDVIFTGASAGDQFGTSVAVRQILHQRGSGPAFARDAAIGAPGALSGKGVVYLFAGVFLTGDRLSASTDAAFRVIGKAGDQLGTSVASADLDGDNYSDLIMYAPGSGRIYVIYGGPSLSGTWDLTTTPANVTITAPSTSAITTADFNNDNFEDLAVGVTAANSGAGAAYVINGRARASLGSSLTLPAAASFTFAGIEPGDHAGAALDAADFNGDLLLDLVVSAPDAAGPSNGRAGAGEAYVIYGGTNFGVSTGSSLASPNVTIFGAAAGQHLGTSITHGFITRSIPTDLVLLAPGASSAGDLDVVYGHKTLPSQIDLAAGIDRILRGNAAAGPITGAAVVDIIGIGAESIVAGVPTAPDGSNANAGAAYAVLSPAPSFTPPAPAISVVQNSTASAVLDVGNLGTGFISWNVSSVTTSPYVSWLSVSPASGSSSVGSPLRLVLTANAAGQSPGTYTGRIALASASPNLDYTTTVDVAITVTAAGPSCTYSLSPSSVSIPGPGASGTLSVTASPSSCAWTAVSNDSWLTVTGGSSGTVSGTVSYSASANSGVSARVGSLTIGGQTFAVSQAAGQNPITVSPTSLTFTGVSHGSTLTFSDPQMITITPVSGVSWTADPSVSWINVSPSSGSASTAATVSIVNPEGNVPSSGTVTGTITVAPSTGSPVLVNVTLNMSTGTTCTFSLSKTSASASQEATSGTIGVSTSSSCSWNAVSNTAFITIISGAAGTGSGNVGYSLTANTNTSSRTGTITIAGQTVTITQSGTTPPPGAPTITSNPSNQIGTAGQTAQFSVTATGNPTLTYQWQVSTNGGVSWTDLTSTGPYSGATTATLLVTASTSLRGALFRAVVSNAGGSDTSNAAMLTFRNVTRSFDGDSRGDLAVFRPSNGTWYILNSTASYGASTTKQWGLTGDVPVAADYDGDGRLDVAVFRAGLWYIVPSSTGAGTASAWGLNGDIPAPGDYDGDGKADLAVYRPSTGIWYVIKSSTGAATTAALGLSTDIPVPADYDGDGITDMAVYRPSSGMWYVRQSGSGGLLTLTMQWGLSGDVPVPGDYDNDGVTDPAVYRPASGMWYIRQSSTNFATSAAFQWGLSNDLPVPADYDGDGTTDLAVYRPANGVWYILQSTTGFAASTALQWGFSTDLPIPNALVRHAAAVAAGRPTRSALANLSRGLDLDADGKADLAVFRPGNGTWYVHQASPSGNVLGVFQWGFSSDTPVAGDYDGDGATDIAVYRPATRDWFVLQSSSHFTQMVVYRWGLPNDIPVPGDYDGDGRTDVAVYRPSTGEWSVRYSSTNYVSSDTFQWGLPGDTVVPGDYDGDGVTDLAVFRPSNSVWYVRKSSTLYTTSFAFQWGLPDDIAVPGDYDGDGTSDFAVYRPSTGVWYLRQSSTGFTTFTAYQWGLASDIPVPSDFDGDGTTDLAVYRPSSGNWYILQSATGFTQPSVVQWGLPGDTPIFHQP